MQARGSKMLESISSMINDNEKTSSYRVNDSMINERSKLLLFNDNDSMINESLINDAGKVEKMASWLVQQFNSPESYEFYLKVGWHMAPSRILKTVEHALKKGNNPGGLFNYIARREMNKNGDTR